MPYGSLARAALRRVRRGRANLGTRLIARDPLSSVRGASLYRAEGRAVEGPPHNERCSRQVPMLIVHGARGNLALVFWYLAGMALRLSYSVSQRYGSRTGPNQLMRDKVVVRPFAAGDADAVSALIATTMRRSNADDYPVERLAALIAYFTPEKLRALAQERDCLVAVSDGAVIATAAREDDELATFFVHPEWQGRGIGTRLLEYLERNARQAGIDMLRVNASVTGVGFYERHGYQRTGTVLAGSAGPQITLIKVIGKPLANER